MDMKKKITDHFTTLVEAGMLLCVFALVFLTMAQSPTYFIITASFLVTAATFVYLSVRARMRLRRAITRMTAEMALLANDLNEKAYDNTMEDTRLFFEELARVKQLLRKREQTRQELLDFANSVAMNMEFGKLLKELMPKMMEATRSSCCAFYTVNLSSNKLEIKHSVGFSKNIYGEFDLSLGEGFVGYTAANKKTTILRDVPEDTVYYIRTFLGKIKPRNLMVVPVLYQEQLTGVLVCASIYEYTREDNEMIELIKYYLGVAVGNGMQYEKTRRLTNELTFQNKLIQDQYEDMKKKLNDKTNLLQAIINNRSDDCLYVLDMRGAVLLWNHGAAQLYGLAAEEAVGKPIEKICEAQNWPSMAETIQTARENGTCAVCIRSAGQEPTAVHYAMTLTRIHSAQEEPIGFIVHIQAT